MSSIYLISELDLGASIVLKSSFPFANPA